MKAEQKLQWIAALLSGDYEQGQGRLRRKDDYCCLGVMCDVAAQQGYGYWKNTETEGGMPRWKFVFGDYGQGYLPSNSSWSSIPPSLQNVLGLLPNQNILAGMNDQEGKSFEQIAQWIEENVEPEEDTP